MGNDFKTYSISDIGEIVTGKTPPARVEGAFSSSNGMPFITPKDMDGRRWIEHTERYLTVDGVESVKRNIIPAGSVSVSCIGSDMGKAILVRRDSVLRDPLIISPKRNHV